MKAEIITIGDEILIGQIIDTNSGWIAKQLLQFEVDIVQMTSIPDTEEAISTTLKEASARADLILITGGLGPTKDDVTKKTAAAYFGTTLIRDEHVLRHVTNIFESRNLKMLDINLQQADVLANCEVLFNDYGTAPGMLVRQNQKKFIFMPGVPFEMKFLMEKHVLPLLAKQDPDLFICHETILVGGIGESYLAEEIKDIESELPSSIKLAYLPTLAFIRLRLSGKSRNKSDITLQVALFKTKLLHRLQQYVIADYDTSIEPYLIKELGRRGATLTTAESCTGGSLAASITAVAGSSAIFLGGTIPYSNALKQQLLNVKEETLIQYGAVSEQTAIEMASGSKKAFSSDYAIATTGIAGPGGGTIEKPVGTIWVAVAGKKEVLTKKFQFNNERLINIERTRMNALLLLWKLLVKEQEQDTQ
ncbi:competence/damage-inducible protein A [Sphingobacterium paramultivorum]|uniref:CinA-like protein n=1 Tax=Sphingobacterium paramultivorum TaxID=2886510 RepID=A0A7G5E4T8_9SPHI|nr:MULTISPECIES: competence/damage-inducible protein A [Sphingobacterium]MCS4165537.1 nicotinamide-nucleotide amidase [Sphingobacterium sp. BIGb0116]QMV69013.1 competence/damage-inducible protein A [Sphingobacterium paramultivorum]WSO12791.1 competence/damage-inducible protein A [Sphingobacterium paramultivorum]